jgi:hypothetical protein
VRLQSTRTCSHSSLPARYSPARWPAHALQRSRGSVRPCLSRFLGSGSFGRCAERWLFRRPDHRWDPPQSRWWFRHGDANSAVLAAAGYNFRRLTAGSGFCCANSSALRSPSRSSNQSSSGKNPSTLGSTYQMVSSIFGGVAFSRAWSEAVYHLREGARQGGPDVSSRPHTINSNRMVRFSSVVAASPCRNEPLNDHECYCLNAWAWGSEADLKPAAIRSFLPQFPTGQDLHSKQE